MEDGWRGWMAWGATESGSDDGQGGGRVEGGGYGGGGVRVKDQGWRGYRWKGRQGKRG